MKTVRRANVELTVPDTDLDALLLQDFVEIDANGKVLNAKKSELEKLKEEIKALQKENKSLKAALANAEAPKKDAE